MISKIVLIICFSTILSGCSTFSTIDKKWNIPQKPKTEKINFAKVNSNYSYKEGFYLTIEDSNKLVNNIDEMKAYSEKLESLIKIMAKYYNAKMEVN